MRFPLTNSAHFRINCAFWRGIAPHYSILFQSQRLFTVLAKADVVHPFECDRGVYLGTFVAAFVVQRRAKSRCNSRSFSSVLVSDGVVGAKSNANSANNSTAGAELAVFFEKNIANFSATNTVYCTNRPTVPTSTGRFFGDAPGQRF